MGFRGRRERGGCLGVCDRRGDIGGVASSFNLVPLHTDKDSNRFFDCGITLHWLIEDTTPRRGQHWIERKRQVEQPGDRGDCLALWDQSGLHTLLFSGSQKDLIPG